MYTNKNQIKCNIFTGNHRFSKMVIKKKFASISTYKSYLNGVRGQNVTWHAEENLGQTAERLGHAKVGRLLQMKESGLRVERVVGIEKKTANLVILAQLEMNMAQPGLLHRHRLLAGFVACCCLVTAIIVMKRVFVQVFFVVLILVVLDRALILKVKSQRVSRLDMGGGDRIGAAARPGLELHLGVDLIEVVNGLVDRERRVEAAGLVSSAWLERGNAAANLLRHCNRHGRASSRS